MLSRICNTAGAKLIKEEHDWLAAITARHNAADDDDWEDDELDMIYASDVR